MGNVKNKCPTFIQSGQFQRRAEIDVNGKPTRTGEVQTNGKNSILSWISWKACLTNEFVYLYVITLTITRHVEAMREWQRSYMRFKFS